MESAITSTPQLQGQVQQQAAGIVGSSGQSAAASSSASSSTSGSIGPFFAVISVLTFLAIVSCVVGRFCFRRRMAAAGAPVTPLDTIKYGGGCLGWLKRKCRRCMAGEVEVGAKVMSCGGELDPKHTDAAPPPPPPLQV